MWYVFRLLIVLHSLQAGTSLSQSNQLAFLNAFCQQHRCSHMMLYDVKGQWNESRMLYNERQLVKFMSQMYLKATVTFTQLWPSCRLFPDSAGITPLLVLFYNPLLQHTKFLKQCSRDAQFSNRILWLILLSQRLLPQLEQDITHLNIRFDSNVYIAIHDLKENIQLVEIYTLGQATNLRYYITDEWTSNSSIALSQLPYKYSKKRRGNLQHYQLRAATVNVNKFYAEIKEIDGQYHVIGGYFGEVFKDLAQALNFTYVIKYLPGYSYGNNPTDNSLWTGVIGELQKHTADLSSCEISIVGNRLEVIDFTLPIHTVARRLYLHEGIKELLMDWYFRPFEISTWFALIVALFLVTSVSTLLQYATHKLLGAQRRAGFLSNLFTFVTVMLQQGTQHPTNTAVRLVLQSSALMFLVVHVAYSAKLTALFTMYRPKPPFHNLADVLKSTRWKFGVIDDSLEFNIFKTADSGSIYGQLWQWKLEPFPENLINNIQAGLTGVLSTNHFVFMGAEDACQNTLQTSFTGTQACQVLVLPERYFLAGLGLGLQKDSPYREVINHSLMKMKSSGLLRRLELKWVPQPRECFRMLYAVTEWTDIVPPLTGFAGMVLTSIWILIAEILIHKRKKKTALFHKNKTVFVKKT